MWANFWNLRDEDRLSQWMDLRNRLSAIPLDQAVIELNNMWSTTPYVNYYLAADDISNWPNPWLLLSENYYCDVAKALGIVYTIYFTEHKTANIELRIYKDCATGDQYNVAYIDHGKYILNLWPYEIVNTEIVEEKQLQLLYRYSTQDLELEKY